MQTFETAAVIKLIDHLSGPLRSLAHNFDTSHNSIMRTSEKIANTGKHLLWSWTLPIAEGMTHIMQGGKELSEVENTLEGVLARRAQTMGMSGSAIDAYVKQQREAISVAEKQQFAESKGLLNTLEFRKTALQAIKANMDAEAAAAAGVTSFDLALSGRVDQHEAADMLINVANAFGLVSQKVDEHGNKVKKTFAEMKTEFAQYADLLSAMSSNANMTVTQAADALRLPAPLAHMTHTDPGFVGAQIEAMAEQGIKGSEAGVNLRSFYSALFAPKSTATASMLAAGVDLNKFRRFEGVTPEGMVSFMRGKGITLGNADVKKLFKNAEDDSGAIDFTKLTQDATQYLRRAGKKGSPLTPDLATKYAQQYLNAKMGEVDIIGTTMAIREAMMPGGALAGLMEKRQIPRSLSYLAKPQDPKQFDVFANAMERMYGSDWENIVKTAGGMHDRKKATAYLGSAHQQAEEHSKGIEGAYLRIGSAFKHLEASLYDSGALQVIADTINQVSGAINKLAASDPATLQNVVKGFLGLAAVGPALRGLGTLGMAVGGIMSLVSALGALASAPFVAIAAGLGLVSAAGGASATGGAAASAATASRVVQGAGAAGGAIAGALPAAGAGIMGASAGAIGATVVGTAAVAAAIPYAIDAMNKKGWLPHLDLEHWLKPHDKASNAMDRMRSMRREPFVESSLPQGLKYFGHDAGPQKVDVGVNVQGEVHGEAQLMNKIVVEPSPLLQTIVHEAQQAKMTLQGALAGRSMPSNSGVVPRSTPSLGTGAGGFGFGVAGTK